MTDKVFDPETATPREKLIKIMEALALPDSHYVLGGSAVMTLHGLDKDPGDIDIFVSTALWFQMYESVADGIIWGLYVPEADDPLRRCDPPYLFMTLLGYEINVFYLWRFRENASVVGDGKARGTGNLDIAKSIDEAEYVGDEMIRCIPLEEVRRWKAEVNREKDQRDIAMIDEYLRER